MTVHGPPPIVYIGAYRVDLPLLKYQPSFWDSYLACKRCDLGHRPSLPLQDSCSSCKAKVVMTLGLTLGEGLGRTR